MTNDNFFKYCQKSFQLKQYHVGTSRCQRLHLCIEVGSISCTCTSGYEISSECTVDGCLFLLYNFCRQHDDDQTTERNQSILLSLLIHYNLFAL